MDIRALDRAASKLRLSNATVHTVISAYEEALSEGKTLDDSPKETYAYEYGRGWFVVGAKVHGKKNLPEDVTVVEMEG